MIPLLLTFLDANIWMIYMNASEKVSDFQRAAEKTGMQFGIASMDTLMRMRAGQFRSGVSSRCQMNYRNTVNQCGVSFPIYRKNAETLLCVVNRKKAERPEFSLLYLLCGASMLTIILSVRFRIFHSSLILAQKTTSANPFWGWRCGFFFGAHFATRPARVICYSSRYRAGIWACSRSPWG